MVKTNKLKYLLAFAAGVLICAGALYFGPSFGRDIAAVRVAPEEMVWNADPKLHGLKTAVLSGDPNKSGPFSERIIIPPNTVLPPHSHKSRQRMVTVVYGTIYFGYGSKFDEAELKPLAAGSFFTEPDNTPHFAIAGKEGVILQLNAIGPDGTKYVKKDN